MEIDIPTRPQIPRKLSCISPALGLLFIAYTFTMILIPGILAALLIFQTALPVGASIVLSIPLFFLSSQGFHLLGFVGHEGFHRPLHPNKRLSALMGIIASSTTVVFLQVGVAIDHWNHHRHTNSEKDPDFKLFGKYKTFLTQAKIPLRTADR